MTRDPSARTHDDGALACLVLLLRLLGQSAEPESLRRRLLASGQPLDETGMLRALTSLGFRARAVAGRWDRLPRLPLPALAVRRDMRFVIVARAAEAEVLVYDPLIGRPETIDRDHFVETWSGRLVLVATGRTAPSAPRFDLTWFIPAVVKYRRLLGEVPTRRLR